MLHNNVAANRMTSFSHYDVIYNFVHKQFSTNGFLSGPTHHKSAKTFLQILQAVKINRKADFDSK